MKHSMTIFSKMTQSLKIQFELFVYRAKAHVREIPLHVGRLERQEKLPR